MSARRSERRRWNAAVNFYALYAFVSIFLSATIGIGMGVAHALSGGSVSATVTILLGFYSVSFLALNTPPLIGMYIASAVAGWRSTYTRKQRWESALKAIHRMSWYIAAIAACLSLLFLGWS